MGPLRQLLHPAVPAAVLAAALLAGAAPAARRAPVHPPARGMFVLLLGGDTAATERFTRTTDQLDATITLRGPLAAAAKSPAAYAATLRPDASVARLVATVAGAPAGSVTLRGDSAFMTQGADTLRRATPPGSVVYIDPSPALMEQIVRRARALGGKPGGPAVSVPVFVAASGGQATTATVAFPAADSVRLALGIADVALRVDSAGAVLGGSIPAQHLTIVRSAVP